MIIVEYSRFITSKFSVQYYSVYESFDEVFRWDHLLYSSELFVEHCCPHEKFSDSCTCGATDIDLHSLLKTYGKSVSDIFSNEALPVPPYSLLYNTSEFWNSLIGFGRLSSTWTAESHKDARFTETSLSPTMTNVIYCRFKGVTLNKSEAPEVISRIFSTIFKTQSHAAQMRSSRKLKVNLKRRPVHLNAQITQKAVPAYPLSFEREENHSQKSEHHSIIRHYGEEGLKDISIPTPFFSDRLSDNESPFSSSSGINCPNDFFNEQALSDPPNLVACSNGESSSELRYYEDLNLGLSNGKASRNMQVNLSDPLHGHSINANLFVDPDCSPTRDANVDEKKLSKQERNRRNVRNFYKRRKVYLEQLEKNNELLKKECLQMRQQLALLFEEVKILKECHKEHPRSALDL